MDVGFIGLGAMGRAMARNLAAAGHRVRAWNRSGSDMAEIAMVATPAEAFEAEVVFTMLADDAAIREVLLGSGVLAGARPGLVHVLCSTISLALADELVSAHAKGVAYVAAPVMGRPDAAARAELNILIAGPKEAIEHVRPLLSVLGRRIWDLGKQQPRANAAKIASNMMITMAIEAMAEATVLVEASGLERACFFELMLGTSFGSRAYQTYSANIAAESYEPGFKASLGLKDLRLAREAAQAAGRALPVLDAVYGRMAEAIEVGMADRDWSVLADFTINHSG